MNRIVMVRGTDRWLGTDNGIGKEEKELDQHHRFVALKVNYFLSLTVGI